LKEKKKKDIISLRNGFLKGKLRSLSLKWPPRNEAMKSARVSRGMYLCLSCNTEKHYSEINLDHTSPVIPLTGIEKQANGEIDWNSHIPRLFCEESNFDAMCITCHSQKSLLENEMRTYYRDEERQRNKTKLKKKK
jgi:hypothetical protein